MATQRLTTRKSVTRSTKLGPEEREAAIARAEGEGARHPRRRRRHRRHRVPRSTRSRAASRTGLLEARDWASGTSSRSSKLVHGGIRYLEQLDFRLVREALIERGLLLQRIAPHLVKPVRFLYPLKQPRLRARLRRRRHDALRHLQLHGRPPARRPAPPPPLASGRCMRAIPSLSQRRARRRHHLLRRPGRRRPLRREPRPHGLVLRRARREPRARSRASSRSASASSASRRTTCRPASTSRSARSRS